MDRQLEWDIMQEIGYRLVAMNDVPDKSTLTDEEINTYGSVIIDPDGKPTQLYLSDDEAVKGVETVPYSSRLDDAVSLISETPNEHDLKVVIKRIKDEAGSFAWVAMIYFFDDLKSQDDFVQFDPDSPAKALCLAWMEYRKWANSLK